LGAAWRSHLILAHTRNAWRCHAFLIHVGNGSKGRHSTLTLLSPDPQKSSRKEPDLRENVLFRNSVTEKDAT
jgi:hypothetical protein